MRSKMYILRITLGMLGLCGPLVGLADVGVYAFVNAQGQVFLSNVPDDGRYQRLDAPDATADATQRATPERYAELEPVFAQPYGALVALVAEQYGIEPALLHAVILVESGYNAKAVSKQGAAGLMQLMPATAKRYGVADVFNPEENVRAGARYLNDLLKLFDNDIRLTLAAYNAGEAAVFKYGRRIPPFRETVAYVPRVVDSYNRLRSSM